MAQSTKVVFKYGTQSAYDNLGSNIIADALYFITDTRRIYKGSTIISSNDAEFVTSVPAHGDAVANKLYVCVTESDISIYVKGSTEMQQIGGKLKKGAVDSIDIISDSVLTKSTDTLDESSDDSKLTTAGAVFKLVDSVKTSLDADVNNLKDVAYTDVSVARSEENNGTVLTFTTATGQSKDVTIADLFLTSANYDPATHILTLTVQGVDEPVSVNLEDLVPKAMATSDVTFPANDPITVTTPVGYLEVDDVVNPENFTDLHALLKRMLSKEIFPEAVDPKASITLTSAGNKEVGSSFTPNFTASLDVGKYTCNGKDIDSGVTAETYAFTASDGDTIAAQSSNTGSFDAFTVEDTTNYTVSVSIKHSAGDVPKTTYGNDYGAEQIAAGTKTAKSSAVKGYRKTFYGTLTSKTGEINSALVRGLTKSSSSALAAGSKLTIDVPAGCIRIVLAYPDTLRDVNSITSAEEFGSEIKDSFTKHVISVEGASAGYATNYKVYVKDLASAQASATTYSVTI